MAELIEKVDPDKSFLVSGEKLNALIALANQWANFTVVESGEQGDPIKLVKSDVAAILVMPPPMPGELLDPYPYISYSQSGFDVTCTITGDAASVLYDWTAVELGNEIIHTGIRETGDLEFTVTGSGNGTISIRLDGYREWVSFFV